MAAIAEGDPIQPTAAGLFNFQGRIIDWLVSLGPGVLKTIPLETLIGVCETAFDATLGAINFPTLPDVFEMPAKAYVRSLIRPLVTSIHTALVGG
jgi:hypothetical protein